jgi:hypothetical protein
MAKKLLHGKRCRWVHIGDYVTARRGKRVVAFDRLWRCDDCNLERRRIYTLIPTYAKAELRYKGRHVPFSERISDEDAVREEIVTTTTEAEIREQANRG